LLKALSEHKGQTLSELLSFKWPLLRRVEYARCFSWLAQNLLCNPKIHKTGFQDYEAMDVGQYFVNRTGYLDLVYNHCISKQKVSLNCLQDYYETHYYANATTIEHILNPTKNTTEPYIIKSFIGIQYINNIRKILNEPLFIIITRNPAEILCSYKKMLKNVMRRKTPLTRWNKIHERNLETLIHHYTESIQKTKTNTANTLHITFESILNDLPTVVNQIQNHVPNLKLTNRILIEQYNKQRFFKPEFRF
jgi:hypothetical protein